MDLTPPRRRRVDTARRRTGCQNCRERRRKCDEARPQCVACAQRGLNCAYQRPIVFKAFSKRVAESSRKSEAERDAMIEARAGKAHESGSSSILNSSRKTTGWTNDNNERQTPDMNDIYDRSTSASLPSTIRRASGAPWPDENASLPYSLFRPSFYQATQEDEHVVSRVAAISLPGCDPVCSSPGAVKGGPLMRCSRSDASFSPADIGNSIEIAAVSYITSPDGSQPVEMGSCGHEISSVCSSQDNLNRDYQLQLVMENALIRNFEQTVLPLFPADLSFPRHFHENRCFHAALLALSVGMIKANRGGLVPVGALSALDAGANNWLYYDSAVKDLNEQLKRPGRHGLEQLASAALLLAYHDMEVGTPLGIRNHACGLDAIASRLDFSTVMTPGLFKAWRMLRCDRKFLSLATRRTIGVVDAYDMSSLMERQIAIRELLVGLWKLYGRYSMEATFQSDRGSGDVDDDGKEETDDASSPSEKVGQWLRSVLNRDCDLHQAQQRDFHNDTLTPHMLQHQCSYFARQLEQWHAELADEELPIIKDSSDADFIPIATSAEPLATYRLPNKDKALDHILYLLSRMICNRMRSLFQQGASSHVSEAWGRLILGIICGMSLRRQRFTLFRLDMLLLMTALLSEGTRLASNIIDHVIPRVMESDGSEPGFFTWSYLKTVLQLVVHQRIHGRSIRLVIDDSIQDSEQREAATRHMVVAFGDYNGRGHFRDVFSIDR